MNHRRLIEAGDEPFGIIRKGHAGKAGQATRCGPYCLFGAMEGESLNRSVTTLMDQGRIRVVRVKTVILAHGSFFAHLLLEGTYT